MVAQISKCRLCETDKLEIVIDLKQQSLSGYFPSSAETDVEVLPLILVKCAECNLVQLQHSVSQTTLYHENYGYRSGINTTMSNHLASLVRSIENKLNIKDADIVIDIASNDGTLLNSYQNKKLIRIGVDPLAEHLSEYYEPGIKKISNFFNEEVVTPFLSGEKAKVITSVAVFYDLERPKDFVKAIRNLLDINGIWVLEQSDLGSMIESNSFDTICHEHLEYYSLGVINILLKQNNLRIFDVELNASNGGSHRIFACHENSNFETNNRAINHLLSREHRQKLSENETYFEFMQRCEVEMQKLCKFIEKEQAKGKTFHVYGASTKGNVLLQYCGLSAKQIEMAADRNPRKWGCYTPGTKIPIQSEETSRSAKPDYLVVLPWHFRQEFIARETELLKQGTSLIFPLPNFEIFSGDET